MSSGTFSQLGLVEMTRKRTRESWPTCCAEPGLPGQGQREDGAQRVLRHPARNPARGPPVQPARVSRGGCPGVVELFLDEESQHLAGLSDFIGKPISLQAESAMGQEQYDIVLLQPTGQGRWPVTQASPCLLAICYEKRSWWRLSDKR